MSTGVGHERIERDALGEVAVPAEAYYGAATARSQRFFAIGPDRMPLGVIHALARIKRSVAIVHRELELLDAWRADLIITAAGEIIDGRHDDAFPLSVFQTGSGTQTNMNVNEVIAGRANELATGARGGKSPVHPNDHVNAGQSSNDAFPTALHLAAVDAIETELLPALRHLHVAIATKAAAWQLVTKLGRTHLQDAVPMRLGDEFGAHASALAGDIVRIERARDGLLPLALGATAVGTGINADRRVAPRAVALLAVETGHAFTLAPDPFAALAGAEPELELSAALRTTAASLTKLANDVRLLGSGPRAGFGELHLSENEPGSSIMPGKVNPTQAEALLMVATQVYGLDAAIALAAVSGQLQLHTARPLIAHDLLLAMRLLADGARSFADHCMAGIEPARDRLAANLAASLMLVTALVPAIGYDRAAEIATRAHTAGTTLREAALASGLIDAATFDALVDPSAMARPAR
jgi:fumarate hydratase class II